MDNSNRTEVKSDFKFKSGSKINSSERTPNDILEAVTEYGKNILNDINSSKEKAMEIVTTTLSSLDKTIKSNPVLFASGAAIFGFAAGYYLGRGRGPSSLLKMGVEKIKSQIEKNKDNVGEHLQ